MRSLPNILAVAHREFMVRIRTRTFVLGSLLLMLGVSAIAFVPLIISYIDRPEAERIAVWNGATDLGTDPVATLTVMLNPATPGAPASKAQFTVRAVSDLAVARTDVEAGYDAAVLAIERAASGEPRFTLYTNQSATGRLAQLIQQASGAVAIADRLARLGLTPTDQAAAFRPAEFAVDWPDPTRTAARTDAALGANYALGYGMSILIFMMIILYGQWVATSVVEEKASRVMEVILNAATPFQLLAGKVMGVGAVALVQYALIIATGTLALLVQGPLSAAILGETSSGSLLPQGLTVGTLVLLGVYGVLGFLLYAVLYAAAGSLVTRQEDVNQAVMPMTLIATGGYIVAAYMGTGLIDARASWVAVMAQVPFFAPFLMLSRSTTSQTTFGEILLSVVLLAAAIVVALWAASRIYAAGVLLYGQRPGLRALWRLMRTGM